jgi:hypothetical protein
MTEMMVKIMVEVLDILGTATKEMKESRASKVILRFRSRGLYVIRKISKETGGNKKAGGWPE